MKTMLIVCIIAAGVLVGCRTAELYAVHINVARGAIPPASIQIWQLQYQSDTSVAQGKQFPFDIGRAAKVQAIPLP